MARKIYHGGTATKPGLVPSGIKNARNGAKKRKLKLARRARAVNAAQRASGQRKRG